MSDTNQYNVLGEGGNHFTTYKPQKRAKSEAIEDEDGGKCALLNSQPNVLSAYSGVEDQI